MSSGSKNIEQPIFLAILMMYVAFICFSSSGSRINQMVKTSNCVKSSIAPFIFLSNSNIPIYYRYISKDITAFASYYKSSIQKTKKT